MKKLLAAILFFGSVGTAMAQTMSPNSPGYYSSMTAGWNPNSPVVRAVTPTIFQAPVQAAQAIYRVYSAIVTCPSQRPLGTCPNNSSKGYMWLPPGTQTCSTHGDPPVHSDLGKYCYKGSPGQRLENSTIIGPMRFQTEEECRVAACGIAVKPLKVEVIVGEPEECPAELSPSPNGTYWRQAPAVAVTFSMSGGTPQYRVSINGTTYRTGSMVTVFMNAYSARTISGTVTDSGSPQQNVPVSVRVPACRQSQDVCNGINGHMTQLLALLADLDPNSARYAAVKEELDGLMASCRGSGGCVLQGNSCVARQVSGLACCHSAQGPNDPPCRDCGWRCLSSVTKIATPLGNVLVTELKVGDIVWTQDAVGDRIVRQLIKVSSVQISGRNIIHLVLADGRSLDVSGPHPAANGKTVGELKAGDAYDGSAVVSVETKPYEGSATYDILPAGETGFYWANGILMGSTLK